MDEECCMNEECEDLIDGEKDMNLPTTNSRTRGCMHCVGVSVVLPLAHGVKPPQYQK